MPNIVSLPPEPEMLRRLVDEVLAGNDVTLFIRSDAGRTLLDAAADCLVRLRSRALRVAGTPLDGLSLSTLMAQVTGQPDPGGKNDEFLRRGFQALTVLDATCDRTVLLISDANTLQPAALRYIQFACHAGTKLQLVFAGRRGFLEMLAPGEFTGLRDRLAVGPILTPQAARPVVVGPAAAPPAAARLTVVKPVVTKPVVMRPAVAGPAVVDTSHDLPPEPQPARDVAAEPIPALARHGPDAAMPWDFSPVNLSSASYGRPRLAALAGIGLVLAVSATLAILGGWTGAVEPRRQVLADALPPESPGIPVVIPSETPPAGDTAFRSALGAAPVLPEAPALVMAPTPTLAVPPVIADETNTPATAPVIAPGMVLTPESLTAPLSKPSQIVGPMQSTGPTLSMGLSTGPGIARRVMPAQPRNAARGLPLRAGSVAAWGDPYSPPPPELRPAQPPQAVLTQPDRTAGPRQAYIGTYSTDANGIRAFRLNP